VARAGGRALQRLLHRDVVVLHSLQQLTKVEVLLAPAIDVEARHTTNDSSARDVCSRELDVDAHAAAAVDGERSGLPTTRRRR
jgi:hypothetical protein